MIECYDVGGTWTRAAVFDEDGTIIKKEKRSSTNDIEFLVRDLHSRLNVKAEKISIAVPGPVKNDILLSAPPLNIETKVNLKAILKDLGKIYVHNDLKAATEAELEYGIGTHCNNFYLLTLSTGIGAGVVINRNQIKDASCEFGHNVVERSHNLAFKCGCGNYGCWSSLTSGKGIENLAAYFLGEKISAKDVFELAEKGDSKCEDILAKVRSYNAQGLGMMVNTFDVEKIIVMGSLGLEQFDKIIPSEAEIRKFAVNPIPTIHPTKLGDDVCLLGSYLLAKKNDTKLLFKKQN